MNRMHAFAFLLLGAFALTFPLSMKAADAAGLFKDKCVSCHGADGSGKTAAGKKMETPDLHSKQFVEMSDKDMFETIARGTRHKKYPHSFLYTGLNETQINGLVAHVRELQKK
ncbi:MAG TPA: c-type cytochrome [Terriglobales bacterium]|nr:c-type cytochrome [Terriglobales bacterium]